MGPWLRERGCFVFGSELRFRIGERTGRKPDLSLHLDPSRVRGHGRLQSATPDIVVEIVTPRPRDERRDRVEKMTDYARARVRWYWIVDPALGSFEVFELTESGTYARVVAATEGSVPHVPGCEGLVLDLDALWSELERVAPQDED